MPQFDPFLGPNHRFLHASMAAGPGRARVGRATMLRVSSTVVAHACLAVLAGLVAARGPSIVTSSIVLSTSPLVWEGGGGGGGEKSSQSAARLAQRVGRDATTMPVARAGESDAASEVETPPPLQQLAVEVEPAAAGLRELPGALTAVGAELVSRGPGTGSGTDGGNGPGSRGGDGAGAGPGQDRGTGGGFPPPGNGITWPRVLREVKPGYTADAMRAKIQGAVLLEVAVLTDGTVGRVRVVRSLDPIFGLDAEAIKAVQAWRFLPATERGRPVAVVVPVEVAFVLR
jgi:TonB family protein